MLLEGKKPIITGGTRGIGYAIAARFIEEGAVVTVFGSRQATADKAVEQLLATDPEAQVWGRTGERADLAAVTEAHRRSFYRGRRGCDRVRFPPGDRRQGC